jgi:hypothetical protein
MKTLLILLALNLASFQTSARAAPMEGKMALGLASIAGDTAITGWIPLKGQMGFQPYLAIPKTTGSFDFLAGSAIKNTVKGSFENGFHLGGNVLLGSVAKNFTVLVGGLIGVHFSPAQNVLIAFDGGPQLSLIDGNADFSIGAVSPMLGLNILYFF